jgi:hypothetical protein
VPQRQRIVLDPDHPRLHVHDVAHPQLALVADEAVHRPGRGRGEAQGAEQTLAGVGDAREVVRHREVVVRVNLPAIDDAAIGLEPVGH